MQTTKIPQTPMPTTRMNVVFPGALTFYNVHHSYQTVPSLKGVSLQANAGEVLCLLGESGCGKTTLLRLAAGIERPTAGRIAIDTKDVASDDRFVPTEQRGVGLIFQDQALFPHLTVLQNVAYGLSSLKKSEALAEARRYLERVNLADGADVYPHRLSGGQQQRVALARALAPRPRVLLMDEPFSGLDRRLRLELRSDVSQILRSALATTILVTHDPEEAMLMGDRIALMRAGKLEQVATPEALYCAPKSLFAARFLSELLEFEGRVVNGGVVTPFGPVSAPERPEGQAVIVGIRPRGLSLMETGARCPETAFGTVIKKQFAGETELVTIGLQALERTFVIKGRTVDDLAPGMIVPLTLDPKQVVIVERPPI